MSKNGSFLRWWLIVCVQALVVLIATVLGFHESLWENDQTKLSFFILLVWLCSTVAIGIWHLKYQVIHLLKVGWFLAESCLALGLMGTVTGFILMFGPTFEAINIENLATVENALIDMALGITTALYTTLIGLIMGQFIKVQLVNLEHAVDKNER